MRIGYGETVCQLIDELVNQELYRRDFEFLPPSFPEDDPNEDSADEIDESNNQDDEFQGKSEMINGIEVQTHSIMSPSGNFMGAKPSKKDQIKRQGSLMRDTGTSFLKAEETKVNFFNP